MDALKESATIFPCVIGQQMGEMTLEDTDFKLVYSPLCRQVSQDGRTVDVHIYRGEHEETWMLEVVAEDGSSTVWDDRFQSDHDALAEVTATILAEGIAAFDEDSPHDPTKH